MKRFFTTLSSVLLLAACSMEPVMEKHETVTPDAFKEAGDWVKASPAVDQLGGTWWTIFDSPELNDLEGRVTTGNQTLKQALAKLDEARGVVETDKAGLLPQVSLSANPVRSSASTTLANNKLADTYNDYLTGATVTYETDLWGRVRSQVKADTRFAEASETDVATAELSIRAELARQYFMLRGYDEMQDLLDKTVVSYQKALDLTSNRHAGGIAMESDVTQAEAQLEDAKTKAADTHMKRAQAEHAIAVLLGVMPSSFNLAPAKVDITFPQVNPGLPASLLQRRPDVASAELQMEAANAEIGVARAAWFPDLVLTGGAGFESDAVKTLFNAPSLLWSFGASVTMPLFDGGRIDGLTHQARARYDESVAGYRQTVLTAFQEVEDNLVGLHQLDSEFKTQSAATDADEKTLQHFKARYEGGITNYLDVVVAQNAALDAEIQLINIKISREASAVGLIKSLGGGWTNAAQDKPKP